MPKPTEDDTGAERPEAGTDDATPAGGVPDPGAEADPADGDRGRDVAAEPAATPSDAAAETVVVPPAPVPEPAPAGRGPGLALPVLLGAALGAAASLFALGAGLVPLPADPAVAGLRGEIAEAGDEARRAAAMTEDLRATLAPLAEDVAALRAAEPAAAEIAPLTDRIAALEAALATATARLAELEQRPADPATDPAALAEDRIAALLAEAEARIAAREAEVEDRAAAAAAETAARRTEAALDALRAALDGGRPIGPALADLRAAGVAVPPALQDVTEPPTLAALQADFPDAARRALSAALRAQAGDGLGDRALAFLRTQTGARSLTPRAGDDPDAVLSRAEAALARGDLAAALAELAALPPESAAELSGWIERAEARRAVADAIAALAASEG